MGVINYSKFVAKELLAGWNAIWVHGYLSPTSTISIKRQMQGCRETTETQQRCMGTLELLISNYIVTWSLSLSSHTKTIVRCSRLLKQTPSTRRA